MDRIHEDNSEYTALARLEDLDDYEIADGDPDIRGWDVRTREGMDVGEVSGLIADPTTMHVRYVEIEANEDHRTGDHEEYLLVPIESATLDDDDDVVYITQLPGAGLRNAPRFGQVPLTRDHDRQLVEFYALESRGTPEHQKNFFGNRRPGRETEAYYSPPRGA